MGSYVKGDLAHIPDDQIVPSLPPQFIVNYSLTASCLMYNDKFWMCIGKKGLSAPRYRGAHPCIIKL